MSVWIISHTRQEPSVYRELQRPEEHAPQVLRMILEQHVREGHRVLPEALNLEVNERYEVLDNNGWLATYWLSEHEVLPGDGAPSG